MTLDQAIQASIEDETVGEQDASFTINVEGETWKCYTVGISYRDLLCYCDKGIATLLVDSIGDKHTFELFHWERDE